MITRSDVTVREVITPTTAAERRVFDQASVGPEGARLQLRVLVASIPPALVITSSAEAAVLEELGRMLRVRLREQEQADCARRLLTGQHVIPLSPERREAP